ncbi:protein translocase subunit SecF [Nodularia chucula]|uniref:protein translocase subunit SecF n=1 Tax=Nodularia chucula TaxID=3093667 RepID=UPI0039C67DAD
MKLSINKTRSLWWAISSAIILISIISMVISWQNPQIRAPLRPGLDFIGGTRLQLERDCTQLNNCDQPINITTVREVAQAQGLGDSSIQIVGENGISIRTKDLDVNQRTNLQTALSEKIGAFDPQQNQIDTVGPTLGAELFRSGIIALIVSCAGIIIYLTFRFQLDYALFAIAALFHDVLVTLGVFSIFGLVLGMEVDSLFIVALLTIIGFSVNDTVVIYDRIRETIKIHPDQPIADTVDDAVNQTLGRSINTSATTMLPLFAIYFLGGESLKNFALALIIGFTAGVYSSLFIASTLLAWWRERTGKSPVLVSTEPVDTSASSQDS